MLLVGTRKGLVTYALENDQWSYQNTFFEAIPVTLAYVDPRDKAWWALLDHGHWGIKLHRSTDQGQTWEALEAPKYPEGTEVKEGEPAATKYLWGIAHGGHDRPGRIWIGTIPGGLFKSENNGRSFELVESLWNHPSRIEHWFGGGFDHPGIHSIVVDPKNSDHLYVGISCAGVFESWDAGETWTVRNDGLRADFLPDPHAEVGHDPHLLLACADNPQYMWQQNHCGIFKSEDAGKSWIDVSEPDGIANFGFALAIDDNDPKKAWVVPAVSDEKRVAINQSLTVCRTTDGGQSWQHLREGLPQEACFDIVYRHALAKHQDWVAFGTTCGNLFISGDEGDHWNPLNHYLPMILSVDFAQI